MPHAAFLELACTQCNNALLLRNAFKSHNRPNEDNARLQKKNYNPIQLKYFQTELCTLIVSQHGAFYIRRVINSALRHCSSLDDGKVSKRHGTRRAVDFQWKVAQCNVPLNRGNIYSPRNLQCMCGRRSTRCLEMLCHCLQQMRNDCSQDSLCVMRKKRVAN